MHTTEIRVRFSELDAYGHVNHAVYITYFETARIEALAAVGLGLDRLQREGFHLVVVELQVQYARSAAFGDLLTVETEIREVRPASSRWWQRITHNGEVVAALTLRGAFTDSSGRPCRVPADIVAALAPLRADLAEPAPVSAHS